LRIDELPDTIEHLERAIELEPEEARKRARKAAFEPIRDDPRFRKLVGSTA